MNKHVLYKIPFKIDSDAFAKQIRIPKEMSTFDGLKNLIKDSEDIANPKGFYKPVWIKTNGDDRVVIGNTVLKSRILKVNLENVHRAFLFIATCGRELDVWSKSVEGMLNIYSADLIKETALQAAVKYIDSDIREKYGMGKLSRMMPGSLEDWPLEEQRPLFKLLGDAKGLIDVCLMDSLMMNPAHSVSGIIFPTEFRFESCQLCPRENCPGRRAAYDKNLYETKYKPTPKK